MSRCVRKLGGKHASVIKAPPTFSALGYAWLAAGCALPAFAGEAPTPILFEEVVVHGKRGSLAGAQQIKRNKSEIVDSIVAEDIDKLPDFSVTDALQRTTGIQIMRDRGEGTSVAIRGLTQMETTLNGREVFTAGWGRNLDFADIPAELVAGIDTYKTSSAALIEGGLGGSVDIRTRRPFDLAGRQLAATARMVYGDLVKQAKPQASMLLSNQWQASDGARFGALFNLSRQLRAWREDQQGTGNPRALTVNGQAVIAPNGATDTVTLGERERTGAGIVLQWQPDDALDLYAEAHHAEFKTQQNGYQLFMTPNATPTFDANSVTLFPGSSDVQSITWTNPAVSNWGSARDTVDRTTQLAVGGNWRGDALTLKTDLSRTRSHNKLFYSVITLAGSAAGLSQNTASGNRSLNTVSLTTPGMVYALRPFDGELTAWQLDGEYKLGGLVDSLASGLRLAWRDASNGAGQVSFSGNNAAANAASLLAYNTYNGYLVGNPAMARDVSNVHSTLGLATAIPSANPLGTWRIREDTRSAYAMAKLKGESLPFDGNIGLRIVHTLEAVSGNQTNTAGSGTLPVSLRHDYVDALPSANLRYELSPALYVRGSLSKTLTRPDFNQLSPSLTLNTVQMNGGAGNPELRPIRADNLDLALEKYFNEITSVHATGFWKYVDGFLVNVSNPEVHNGATYQVSRPRNSNPAHIRGVELGYQQFYDFLPGWLGGLGMQANYTYIESETPNSTLGQNMPLQNLSRRSYNAVAMYELESWSARLAYNWRDRFLSSVSNIAGVGALPVYTKAYGWLDASLSYRYSNQVSLSLEGTNLLRTKRSSYYGVETRPQTVWSNDMQLSITLTVRL